MVDVSPPGISIAQDNAFTRGEWANGVQSVTYGALDNVGVKVARAVVGNGSGFDHDGRLVHAFEDGGAHVRRGENRNDFAVCGGAQSGGRGHQDHACSAALCGARLNGTVRTAALPHTRAGKAFQATLAIGVLAAMINPATPTGWGTCQLVPTATTWAA